MVEIENKNFAFQNPAGIENGTKFIDCNFIQKQAHTAILAGVTGLIFDGCNLTNCDLPVDAVILSGSNKHKSFCYHLRPHWDLPVENDNCVHVVDTDTITIDGQVIDTIYHREEFGVI